jgi:hypothetical protein
MIRTRKHHTILVTGAPRSGTTAVGDQLGLAQGAATIYEPMNPESGDRVMTKYFERPGVAPLDDVAFDNLANRIVSLSLNLKSGIFAHETGLRKIAKYVIGGRSRVSLRRARLTPGLRTLIWKDPIAALAARSAVERLGIPVVITYRQPEAVVASYKRLNWSYPVHRISADLGGANLYGPPLRANAPGCIIDESAALWSMLYGELLEVAKAYPDLVTIVDMDAALSNPRETFTNLFDRLSLEFGARSERGLSKLEQRLKINSKSSVPSGHPHSQNRNLRDANSYWRHLLSEKDLGIIRDRTETVRRGFETFAQAATPQVIGKPDPTNSK